MSKKILTLRYDWVKDQYQYRFDVECNGQTTELVDWQYGNHSCEWTQKQAEDRFGIPDLLVELFDLPAS